MANSGILDSSVLIDCLRGRIAGVSFLASVASAGIPATHVIVAAEILTGARDKREQELIDSFLAGFAIISPTELDGLAALDMYRSYHLSHGVDWPDCQIAATAIRLGLEVLTLNVKHFAIFPGLRVVRPY